MIQSSRKVRFLNYDWVSILILHLLIFIGIISIYSTTHLNEPFSFTKTVYGKQILWFIFSYFLILLLSIIPIKTIKENASLIYLLGIFLLIFVLLFSSKINGNKSWFRIGPFSLQPAEFVKVSTVLGLAKLLTESELNINKFKNLLQASILIATPILLILLQPDLGTAIVFLSLFIVLYREGLSETYYLLSFLLIILFILTIYFGQKPMIVSVISVFIIINALIYFMKKKINIITNIFLFLFSILTILGTTFLFKKILKPHQKERIEIILQNKKDDKGSGYNLKQALLAFSSGGMQGKGFLKGTQTQGDYIPEQHTDWILTVIGEEWGFIGTFTIILLYTFLLLRLIFLAERQKQRFSRILGYGLVSFLFFHYALNFLMAIGMFPTIGIPFPFLSYGGSSLWAFILMFYVFLKFDAHRVEDW